MASVAVIELSGIGPVLAGRLNKLGLFTTEDLLRTDRLRLADLVEGASSAQIRRWQAIGELLEVDGMTLPLAEGLYARGVETLDELAGSSLTKLRGIVKAMRAAGIIMAKTSDDDLVRWMKDALLLRHTGTLNGTVIGPDKKPVDGVEVRCMGKVTRSDPRGRFRIRRLPLGRVLLVHLEHPAYGAKTTETGKIAPPGVLLGERFQLSRQDEPAPRVLSQLHGDRLPSLAGAPVTTSVQAGPPPENDLLRVFAVEDDGRVRAISRWFDYEGGRFVIRSYRLAPTDLAPGAQVGDHLRFTEGRWKVVPMTRQVVERLRRVLRQARLWPPLPPNPTAADVERAIRDFMAARAKEREQPPH